MWCYVINPYNKYPPVYLFILFLCNYEKKNRSFATKINKIPNVPNNSHLLELWNISDNKIEEETDIKFNISVVISLIYFSLYWYRSYKILIAVATDKYRIRSN